jgi:hypothetical protein
MKMDCLLTKELARAARPPEPDGQGPRQPMSFVLFVGGASGGINYQS